jgi:hydroxymethylbilane synthase
LRALRIGTRGSALALWQARAVAGALEQRGRSTEIVTITTRGDRRQDAPLTAIGGKGVFVKEIHDALLGNDIDLAVHSAKDMAARSPEGLTIAAVLPREDPRDALILRGAHANTVAQGVAQGFSPAPVADLVAQGFSPASIGTGSPRRIAQLRRRYPGARFEPIRGNVDTRLKKLDAGEVDALVLACAGLRRLGLEHRITSPIVVTECVPAPGQGIIAIETRQDDEDALGALGPLNDSAARTALAAEQAVVGELGGGCQLPLGVFAELNDVALTLRAVAASMDGTSFIEEIVAGDTRDPREAGIRLARQLAARGARELLQT